MMVGNSSLVAKRYATAWLNIFGQQLSPNDFKALNSLASFLNNHKNILIPFKLLQVSPTQKMESLQLLFRAFSLEKLLQPLASLLVKDGRLFLLPGSIRHIIHLYKEQHRIMECALITSHALSPENIVALENFLTRKTGYVIISKHTIDKKLIAGIRLQSDTLLWEYSIRKQLERAYLPLIR